MTFLTSNLSLLPLQHSERPKSYSIFAFLSAMRLRFIIKYNDLLKGVRASSKRSTFLEEIKLFPHCEDWQLHNDRGTFPGRYSFTLTHCILADSLENVCYFRVVESILSLLFYF